MAIQDASPVRHFGCCTAHAESDWFWDASMAVGRGLNFEPQVMNGICVYMYVWIFVHITYRCTHILNIINIRITS